MGAQIAVQPTARKAWNILVAFLFVFNVFFGVVPAVSAQAPDPTIATDKGDYQPGETVYVTGANWQGDTQVRIVTNDDVGQTWQNDATVMVAEDGTIKNNFVLPSVFIARYMVTATGVQTGRTAITTFTDAAALSLTKSASPLTYTAAGQVINFSYLLANTGTTALNGPFTVTDNKVPTVTCPATATLALGASITCTGTYTITAADLALGYAVNKATAFSSNPGATTSNTDARIVSIPVDCRNDSDGVNDVPGQKDLTQACGAPTSVNPEVISWNWDDTSQTGANTMDACALFDTNNNGLANYVICVSWDNTRTMVAGYPKIYSCTDISSERCYGSTELPITHGSACALELANDDPFAAGGYYPLDTKAFCSINLNDVGGASSAQLIDVCSYPSQSPNSDPSDCVFISAAKANMEVIKSVVPNDTNTNWNVSWTGPTPYSTTITGSGETGIQTVNLGTYTATEAAGTGTDLSLYDSTWTCTKNGAAASSGSGTTTTGLSLAKADVGICTFTNTRKTASLEIMKDVVPNNPSTNWNFAVTGPDPTFTTCSIAGDGTCGAKTVFTGSYSITETAGSGTSLGDYGTTYACTVNGFAGPSGSGTAISGLTINKSDVVVCTFTNSQSPGTITVNKVVVPSSDTGKFNLQIDGVTKTPNVGDGGTTGAVSVSAGSHTVGETAGTGADLNNYVTTITGDCDSSGNVSVSPNQNKTCTITNTRKGTIIVEKQTDPDGAAGSFTFTGDAAGTISDNGQIVVSNLTPGTYTSTESGLAADFSLESISCDDGSSATPSTIDLASKTATFKLDPGETVKCTFTNKKLNPDLAVTKTADAASVTAGDPVGFLISVTNNGQGTANNVTLSDTLPAIPGVTWAIASQPAGNPCSLAGASLSCTFGNLAPGATAGPVHITGTTAANSCGTWDNTATAQADNNTAVTGSASIFVDCATIKIAKTAGSSMVSAGDSISYTITVTNDNTGTARNVSVSDTLPTNSGLGAWTLSGADAGACSISAGVLTCSFGDIAGHGSKTVTLTASTTAATCGPVSNTASVTTSNDGGDSSTATVTVQCPSLSVTKIPDAATVSAGDPVGFIITVHNAGPGVAKSVTLSDTLPAGLTWTAPSGCSIASGVLSCSLGDLASGADAAIHITATSSPSTCGPMTNEATATPTNGAAATSDPATITVDCADVTVTKTGNGPVSAGDTATFTIVVSVTGAGSLSNVTLNDLLPQGVTWALDAAVSGCSIAGTTPQTLSCSWATLAAPQTITIKVNGTTDQADCAAPLSNTATVAAANETDTTNDTASASITVNCANIVIEKTTDTPIVSAGDTIKYTIAITNIGEGTAYNLSVTDTLPSAPGLDWTKSSLPTACTITGGVLNCPNLIDLPAHSVIYIYLTSPTTYASCGTITNTASATTSNDGSVTSEPATITVNCPALAVTKIPDAATVSAGDTIGYTITVSNAGPGVAKGVMISDSLPGGLAWTVDAGNTTATGCSITSGVLTCGPDTIASGGSVMVHVTAASIPAVCGTLTNTATATPANGDAATSSASDITVQCPDLIVTKTGNGPISAGDTATYTITVTNSGLGEARGVTLSDTLPGGLAWTIDAGNTTATGCSIAGAMLTCGPDTLASLASVKVTVSAVTSKENCGTLTNSASVAATNEANTSNNSSGDADIEVDCATIQIEKTTTTPTVSAGDPISYTITVSNPGLGTAKDVVVTDSLPGGLTWTIAPAVTGCSISGSTLTCNFGSLASGGSKTVTVTATTTAGNCGTLTNTASVTTSNDGAATSPATDISVQCPNLSVTKTADADAVSAGDTIGYTITVSNAGPGEAKGVMISDSLPGGLSWAVDAGNTTATGCSVTGSTLSCGPDTIASGGSVKVHVTAASTQAVCGTLTNTATATPANGDAATSTASDITVYCPDLTVTKTATPDTISAGDTAVFTIEVKNTGPGEAKNVTLTDTLPSGVTWALTPAVTGCSISGTDPQVLTCTWATLASDADISIIVSGATTAANCGVLNNTAAITAGNEADTANNSDDASIAVNCATIQIVKSTTTGTVSAGTPVNFTITVTNPGAGIARNVIVTDSLPTTAGLVWTISPAVSGCSITGTTLTCNFGDIAAGGSASVTVTSPTTAASCGTVSNTASVTTANDGSGQSSASVTVNCPDLTVTKTGNGPLNAGDTAIYTIVITNSGAGDATGVTLSDQLPAGISWSVDTPSCSIDQSGLLSCSFGALPAGQSITIHASGTTSAVTCGSLDNTVTVSATNEAETGNNSGQGSIAVNCASIGITKTAPSPISAGDTLTYTITVSNTGSGTAYGVTVTDTLPTTAGLGPWTVTPGLPTCTITSGVLNCSLGDMAAGTNQTITLSSPTTYASCGTIFNEAGVSTANDGVATAGTNVEVQCPALTLTKTADAVTVSAGDALGFTITVTNTGDGVARNVTLSDTLPTGTGIAWSIDPANSDCTLAGASLSCAFGDLARGESKSVHVTSPTTKDSCGAYDNTAAASADNQPSVTSPQASVEVQCTAVTITKIADQGPFSAGDIIGFTITVTNPGPATAYGVTASDTLPANPGLDWSIDPSVSGCSISSGVLTCNFGTMAANATKSVHISSPTTAATCGMVTNTASVTTTNDGSAEAGDSLTVECPDLTIEKKPDAGTVSAGDTIGFTITVTNQGLGKANGVTLSDTLPANPGLDWTIDPAVAGCQITSGVLTCDVGTLNPAATFTVHVSSPTTPATCGGTVDNTATVTATNEPGGQANNSAGGSITVDCPALTVTKKADAASVNAGDVIGFTITVSNGGTGVAKSVTLTDTLPSGSGISWSIAGGTGAAFCDPISGGVLTCSFGDLAAGASFNVHVTSPTDATSCGAYNNTATVTSANQPDVTGTDSVTVNCATISITKTTDTPTVSAGDPIHYTIVVTNGGDGVAHNVTVTDILPNSAGLDWTVAPAVSGCSVTAGVLTCSLGDLAGHTSQTITLTSPTTYASCAALSNTASVTTSNDGSANSETATITVNCPALDVTKTADAAAVSAGDQIGFTITVTNTGDGVARNVALSDTLPTATGISWSIASSDPTCTLTGSSLSCAFGDLAKGESKSVRVTSPTTAGSCATYDNTATASADNQPSVTSPQASVTVNCAGITITKVADYNTVSAGDTVGFTIEVTNPGPGTAYGVTITDTLPTNTGLGWTVDPAVSQCSINSGVLTCDVGTLPANKGFLVHISSPTTAATCGTVENSAHVSTTNDGSADAGASITVNCPDVTVTKTAASGTINAGDPLTFNITVTNSGAGTAKSVTLSDTLPTGTGLDWSVGGTDGAACSIASGVVTCDFGDLAAGATKTMTLSSPTTKDSCGTYSNTATVAATNEYASLDNNSSTASITVNCATIAITKTPNKDTVNAGDEVSFTITVTNNGAGTARDIVITDTLPANPGLSWSLGAVSAPQGSNTTCNIVSGVPQVLSCTADQLAAGESITTQVISATTPATACATINNTAEVTTSNDGSAQASASITVTCASISITKEPVNAAVSAGDTIAYKIVVTNNGLSTASAISITDTLPDTPGLHWTFSSLNAPLDTTGGCSITTGSPQVMNCSFDQLVAGGSITVQIASPTTYATCGTVSNTASVTTANDGSATTPASEITVNCSALEVTKTPDTQTVSAGEPVTFTIMVKNTGTGTAKNVTLSDQLPLGVTWSVNNSGCGVDANGLLACGFGDIAAGDSASVTVTGDTTPAMCGTFDNTATIQSDNGPDVTSNTVNATVKCPDVTVTKEAVSGTISAGDTAAFKIVVSNVGSGTAYGVTLTDTLPAGVTWTIDPPVTGCSITGGVLSCSWSSLAAGASVEINVSGATGASNCGTLDNTVTVAAANEAAGQTNNQASASITVNCADVADTKAAVSGTINAGDTASFKIVVSNVGSGTAYNVTVNDTLPAGVAWTIDPAVTGCSITGNTLSCSFATLAAGASVEIYVSGTTSASNCGTLDNTVTVAASNETNTKNNTASASITVNCADVTVTKEAVNSAINAGDMAAFKMVVSNIGAGTAYNVTLTDTLPAGITWSIDPAVTGCAITGNTLSCSFASLAAGASVEINVSGATSAATCGKLDNTVTVAASNETNTANNTASASITVKCMVDLTITKTASTAFKRAYTWDITKDVDKTLVKQSGGTATFNYTVNVTQTGITDSNWVVSGKITVSNSNTVDIPLTSLTDAVNNGGTCAVLNFTAGTQVPKGGSLTYNYTCTYAAKPDPYNGTNTATVTWDPAIGTPHGSATATVDFAFGNPTLVNQTVTVKDTFNGTTTTLGTVTATDTPPYARQTYNYSHTLNIPDSDCKDYKNTAVIKETGQSASQVVKVCTSYLKTGAKTMGYWQNKNGQNLILKAGAVSGVCKLTPWLRQYAPFQDLSATASCKTVATYVTNVIKAANAGGASMNKMLKGQMLATALDVYFSDPALGGNKLDAPAPIGGITIDISKWSGAFGGATSMKISDMLAYAASKSNVGGSQWYGNVKSVQGLAKNAFDAINNQHVSAP